MMYFTEYTCNLNVSINLSYNNDLVLFFCEIYYDTNKPHNMYYVHKRCHQVYTTIM